jgi:hypothetical protein
VLERTTSRFVSPEGLLEDLLFVDHRDSSMAVSGPAAVRVAPCRTEPCPASLLRVQTHAAGELATAAGSRCCKPSDRSIQIAPSTSASFVLRGAAGRDEGRAWPVASGSERRSSRSEQEGLGCLSAPPAPSAPRR